jgi:hypothetical protein
MALRGAILTPRHTAAGTLTGTYGISKFVRQIRAYLAQVYRTRTEGAFRAYRNLQSPPPPRRFCMAKVSFAAAHKMTPGWRPKTATGVLALRATPQ